MRKAFLLAWSNIRKAKGQSLALIVVLIFSVILLQIGLILAFDYPQNYDKRAEITNTEDAIFSFQTRDSSTIEQWKNIISGDERTDVFEMSETLCHAISFKYGDGETDTHVIIQPSDTPKTLGKFNIVEKSDIVNESTIYLPYLLKSGGGYKIGDSFDFKIKDARYSYKVGGFYENTLIGSFNTGVMSFLLSPQGYKSLDENSDIQGVSFSIKLKNREQIEKYFAEVGTKLDAAAANMVHSSTNYAFAKNARTVTATICAAIFFCLSLLIMLIALVVTAFRISNNIDEDMRTYGALKAVGYTGSQIIGSVLLQFLLSAIVACVIGAALSYVLLPAVSLILAMQTGLVWSYVFNPIPLLLVLGCVLGTVALTSFFAAAKLKKLQPIVALRQGTQTHSFKRNPFPLQSGKINVNVALSFKFALRNMKQNVSIFFIILLISVVSVLMSVLFNAFVVDGDIALGLAAGEFTDAAVYTSSQNADEIFDKLKDRSEVEKVYKYESTPLTMNADRFMASIVDDCENLNNKRVCYDGRLPLYSNEIAIGGLGAKQHNIRIGDEVFVEQNGLKAGYIVSGFIQGTNFMGKDMIMLISGHERISDAPPNGSFFIDLKEGQSIETFIENVWADYSGKIINVINYKKLLDTSLSTFSTIISLLVIFFAVILFGIIALVLYLIIKTFLIRRQKDYGVLKAIGYKSGQLMFQTVLGYMPVIIAAAIAGFIIGIFVTNPLLTLLFQSIGIMKAVFPIPAAIVITFALLIILSSLAISTLMSLRVRRIAPCALIKGE